MIIQMENGWAIPLRADQTGVTLHFPVPWAIIATDGRLYVVCSPLSFRKDILGITELVKEMAQYAVPPIIIATVSLMTHGQLLVEQERNAIPQWLLRRCERQYRRDWYRVNVKKNR